MNEELEKLIEACNEKLVNYTSNNEVINSIMEIINKLKSQDLNKWTGDELTRAATKLSLFLVNLSQIVTESRMRYNSAYGFRKFKTSIRYLELQEGTVKDKEMLAQKFVNGILQEEVYENYRAETLKALYGDCERIVSVIQSRIKVMLTEKFESNLQI